MPLVRHRYRRPSDGGGTGLRGTTALLRPALEAAMSVARDGEKATPPLPAPAALKRYLLFARLPDPALDIARKVLDEDDAFRGRVVDALDEEKAGRAAWVWLTRPPGWQSEFDDLKQRATAEDIAVREERNEREAQRRLVGAEAALARAESLNRTSAVEINRLRTELGDERLAARALAGEVERLGAELERVASERAAAIRRVKEMEGRVAERGAEVRQARHDLRMAQAEFALAPPPRIDVPAAPVAPSPAAAAVAAPDPLDRVTLARAVADAADAATRLSAALAAASSVLEPVDDDADSGADATASAVAGNRSRQRAARERRRPAPLPGGVLDDSPAAAEHLVRLPGALVLVDGYNISQAQWYGRSLAEQRSRLLDACAELHARAGTDIEVVFDGTGDEATNAALVRASVRFRFTPAGLEADDELLARVEQEPAERVIVLASSDNRVRDGARQRGANVISARQLLAVLRR